MNNKGDVKLIDEVSLPRMYDMTKSLINSGSWSLFHDVILDKYFVQAGSKIFTLDNTGYAVEGQREGQLKYNFNLTPVMRVV